MSESIVQKRIAQIDAAIAAGPFKADWLSLETASVPRWYEDDKFGIFIHWGVYSVPAFGNEWYPRNMYIEGSKEFRHHVETYGPHSKFGYKDFIPMFKAQRFNADAWAKLFKAAGAKFVVPVAEHHDGFQMYASGLSKWNAARMGPRKNIVGLLAAAVRKGGLRLGVSSHRIEHWWFMNGGMKFDSDVKTGKWADFYGPTAADNVPPSREFMDDWLARSCELIDLHRPELFWFDWWIEQPVMKSYLRRFAAYYYNRAAQWGIPVAINYKNDAFSPKSAVLDIERGQLADIRPLFWQNDTAVAKNSWCNVRNLDYKMPAAIVGDLVDVVSKNGALLLNVGPASDGTIPAGDQKILLEVGQWLKVNGEAIYGTRPWKVYGEGPTQVGEGSFTDTKRKDFTAQDFRFTSRGQTTVYAIGLGWPADGVFTIRSLGSNLRLLTRAIEGIDLLGGKPGLQFKQDTGGLKVTVPSRKPCRHAFVLKLTLK